MMNMSNSSEEYTSEKLSEMFDLCNINDLPIEAPLYIYLFYPEDCKECAILDSSVDEAKYRLYERLTLMTSDNNNNNSNNNNNNEEEEKKRLKRFARSLFVVAPYPNDEACRVKKEDSCSCRSLLNNFVNNNNKDDVYLVAFKIAYNNEDESDNNRLREEPKKIKVKKIIKINRENIKKLANQDKEKVIDYLERLILKAVPKF